MGDKGEEKLPVNNGQIDLVHSHTVQVEKNSKEEVKKEWHEIFIEFFSKVNSFFFLKCDENWVNSHDPNNFQIGMVEIDQAFKMELIVFSSGYERQLPKHIDWLIYELNVNFIKLYFHSHV